MLANPVVIPLHADPLIWFAAIMAMAAEVVAAQAVLRRMGVDVTKLDFRLMLVQIVTWIPFLFAVAWVSETSRSGLWIAGLEVLVVAVEVPLIMIASRGWFVLPRLPSSSMTPVHAFVASLVGNMVSIAISLGTLFLATVIVSQGA